MSAGCVGLRAQEVRYQPVVCARPAPISGYGRKSPNINRLANSPPGTVTRMSEHQIVKPILFISHASSDGEFANAVKEEIEKVFADGVNVFCTSSPGAINVGADWLSDIEHKLGVAQAVIAIVTPVSIERPWLWFELGATWSKGRSGHCRIYPLCAPEVALRQR